MNPAIYNISLDVNAMGSQTSLAMRQNDTGRILRISLRNGSEPYKIAEGCTVVFAAKKPDGTVIFNDCTVNNDLISYAVTSQTVAVAGMAEAEIRVYDTENHLLCSPRFDLIVDETVYTDEAITSTNEFTTLTTLISEATRLIEDTNAALANGDFVPNLTIGKVESLPSYESAAATITGTGKNPVLNLGIPRGGNGSEVNHDLLLGLDLPSQHPIKAIIGLRDELDSLLQKINGKQPSGNYALKSELPTALSELSQDASHRLVSDTEKSTWNSKQAKLGIGDIGTSFIADGAVTEAKLSSEFKGTLNPKYSWGKAEIKPGTPSSKPDGTLYFQYKE